MQKTTTLKDFKVLVLKTILAIFVLSISFKGIGQDLRTKKFPNLPTAAQSKATKLAAQKATAPLTDAEQIALKQQMRDQRVALKQQISAQGSNPAAKGVNPLAMGAKASSNKAVTAAQKQSDNPGFTSSPNVMASPNKSTVACLFSGSLVAGDLTMGQRLFRPGTAGGTCATPQPFPGTFTAGLYLYDTYTFVNTTGAAACVTANLTTTDAVNANIQHGAWLGSFNPANMATNYIADPYVSTGTPAAPAGLTFSFNLANGATVVFVVWSANPNTAPTGTASQYTLSVDGLPNLCPQPACVPSTAAVISAVSIPFSETFDAVPIPPVPSGWTMKNNSVPGLIDWFNGNAAVFPSNTGASYIAVNFNSTSGLNTISNWLMTPTTTLHNGDQLKFWTRTTTGAFPDRLQVRMSQSGTSTNVGTTATDVGDFGTLLLDINPTYTATGYPIVWTQQTATVTGVPAAGISGKLAFRYFVEGGGPLGNNSDYIGIDDVQYIGSGSPSVCAGGSGFVKVDITGGSSPFTLVLNANPPGGAGGNFTITNYTSGTLIPVGPINATTTYTIVSVTASGSGGPCTGTGNSGSAVFNLTPASTSAILSQVQIPGPATALISEDFAIAPPASWAIQNNSAPGGLISWFQGNATVFAAPFGAATSYLAANFNSTAGANTISNWAMPPSVLAKNGDVLTFWTRTTTGAFPDRLQVRMNTVDLAPIPAGSPTSVGNYTNLLLDINPTYSTTGYPTAWTKFTITMSGLAPAGQNVRFAFRYFVENGGPAGANSDYIGIDSVRFTTFPLVNPTTCTGSTANLKVDITGGTSPYTVVIGATPAQAGFPKTVTGYISGSNIPVTPPVTTTYNLISVTSADGCLGTGNSGTPTITVSPTTIGGISIVDQPTGPLCAGDPKLLTVVGASGLTCFTNAAAILVPGAGTSGPAGPYPSNIVVSGLPTSGVSVTSVKLTGITHTWESDISVLVQNPAGTQNVIVMSAVNGTENGGFGILNKDYTFSDAAPTGLTLAGPTNPSGTYKPSNNSTTRSWPAPGPGVVVQGTNPLLSTFTGDPNGTWKLYIFDAAAGDVGTIAGGWQICFTVPSAPPVGFTWLWSPAAGLSSTTTNPVAASPMVTTTYTVMGTAPSGCQTTAAITITVLDRPAVTQHPANVSACDGTSATFTAAGSGAGATFQWQVSTSGNPAGPWVNVPGATSPTLTINPVTNAMNGYRYRLVVSGTCTAPANSNSALLTVVPGPTVAITPSGTICGGVAGIFGVALTTGASGPPVPGSVTVSSGTINLAVPDNTANGVSSSLTVAGVPINATITNVSVTFNNFSHTYPGDMIINLKPPTTANILNLYKYGGGAGTGASSGPTTWGWYGATVSQTGTVAWATVATAPFIYNNSTAWKADAINVPVPGPTIQNPTGFVSNAANFQALYTTAASTNGVWTLAMADGGAGDVGTLGSWSIKIDYTTPSAGAPTTFTWSPATGLYTNTQATTPYIAGTQTPTVYAAPTVQTVYTVTGTSTSTGCSSTASVIVNATPPPPIVTPNPVSMCLGDPAVRLISSSAVPGTCTTSTGTISVPIPDNTANGIANTLNVTCVPAGATVTGVTVTFSVPNHTYVGDLIVNLKSPNGTIINLDKYMSGSATQAGTYPNSGFVNANFGSAITSPALGSATSTPISGNWAADMLNGTIPFAIQEINGYTSTATSWTPMLQGNGAWTLAMADGGPADIGTFTGWSIKIDYFVGVQTTAATWSPVGGLFTDAGATVAYTGTPRDTVWTRPTPAGVYNYNVTVNGINPIPTFSNTTAIPIQDNVVNQSSIVVSNLPTTGVTVRSVTLNGFSHTWSGDVNVGVQSPAGGTVILLGSLGNDALVAANGVNLTFRDNAATAIPPTSPMASGTYKCTNYNASPFSFLPPGPSGVVTPVNPANPQLSSLTGNMNGTWKLWVEDRVGGDVGSISGGWSIDFNDPTPGCTSPARVVTVTVNNPIVVTVQPVNHTVCTNGSTSFTVAATGTNVSYQWQVSTDAGNTWTNITNNANYSGATTATLTITNPPVAWNGFLYRAMVNGAAPCPSVPSNNVVLTVNPLPTITLTAAPYRNLLPGLQTTINANSSPVAATYQWFRNGVAVPPPAGTSGPGLTIGVDGIGTYSVRITDVNGCTNTSGTIVIGDSTSGRVFIYPNPTTGRFGVRYNPVHNGVTPFGVVVRDALGKLVWNQQYTLGQPFAPMNVDLSNMASGVYWVEVVDIDNNRLAVGRVVVGH